MSLCCGFDRQRGQDAHVDQLRQGVETAARDHHLPDDSGPAIGVVNGHEGQSVAAASMSTQYVDQVADERALVTEGRPDDRANHGSVAG